MWVGTEPPEVDDGRHPMLAAALEYAQASWVRVHGRGCWVPLPPTRSAGRPALWVSRGQAPHALLAQACVAAVLRQVAFGRGGS